MTYDECCLELAIDKVVKQLRIPVMKMLFLKKILWYMCTYEINGGIYPILEEGTLIPSKTIIHTIKKVITIADADTLIKMGFSKRPKSAEFIRELAQQVNEKVQHIELTGCA